MKLSEMRELLLREDIQLTKSLGQNFLHDGNQLRRIVEAAELTPADKVLEIGPGLGPLTELLLKNSGEVFAIEKDLRLVNVLAKRFEEVPSFELLHDDALEYLKRERRDWRDWKLVANLPYSVASPILVELAQGERSPQRLVATLQWEVARRLMAQAGDDDYGLLTLLVQLDFAPRETFKIPPGCFFPQPEVDSACVVLERRAQPFLPEELRKDFHKIVKRAFSQRRKMMFKLLKADWAEASLRQAFEGAGLSLQTRAEVVSVEQFVALTSLLR
jgi:16S rRNA (adenine1518-N6/adenine1519-N6)-dimethyltransferase